MVVILVMVVVVVMVIGSLKLTSIGWRVCGLREYCFLRFVMVCSFYNYAESESDP